MIRIDFRKSIDMTTDEWKRAYKSLVEIQNKHNFPAMTEEETIESFRKGYNDEELVLTWLNLNFSHSLDECFYVRNDENAGWITIAENYDEFKKITHDAPDLKNWCNPNETIEVKRKSWHSNWVAFNEKENLHACKRCLVVNQDHTRIAELDLDHKQLYNGYYYYGIKEEWQVDEEVREISKWHEIEILKKKSYSMV